MSTQMIHMDCNQISVKRQPQNKKATQSFKSEININIFSHKECDLSFSMN